MAADNGEYKGNKTKDDIATQAVLQIQDGLKHKQPRVEAWQKAENLYQNKKEPTMVGRFNVPLPILGGYVDTLMSKIDEAPALEFQMMGKADYLRSKKITAAWEIDSSSARANWAKKDRAAKKICIFTGRAIYKIYAENDPTYAHYLEVVDSYDYIADPIGGSDLENHRFGFQDNIFRSKHDLLNGKQYDKSQVAKLVATVGDEAFTKNELAFRNKLNRFTAVGLDDNNLKNYDGQHLFRLVEGFTECEGERYWLLIEPETGIWVRCEKLRDVFDSRGRGEKSKKTLLPFGSWASHEDPFNFWSKAVVEDIVPIAISMKTVFNQALYNVQKRNNGQRAFDPSIFKNPALLDYRPDGLVPANATEAGKNIGQGIYEFKTEDNTAITVNLIGFLDNFLGTKTGITPSSQGNAEKDKKVGIYFGDLQQVADRMGMYNKSYTECDEQLGIRYIRDIWENFTEKIMVRWVGEDGVEFDELREEDIDPGLVAIVKSGAQEAETTALKQKMKLIALSEISGNPRLAAKINSDWEVEEKLRAAGYDEEEIREATDLQSFGTREEMAEASQAIQDILEGKKPKTYYGATTAFMQKILNFANKKRWAMSLQQYQALMSYAEAHTPIASENMTRQALFMDVNKTIAGAQNPIPGQGGQPQIPNELQMPGPSQVGSAGAELPQL